MVEAALEVVADASASKQESIQRHVGTSKFLAAQTEHDTAGTVLLDHVHGMDNFVYCINRIVNGPPPGLTSAPPVGGGGFAHEDGIRAIQAFRALFTQKHALLKTAQNVKVRHAVDKDILRRLERVLIWKGHAHRYDSQITTNVVLVVLNEKQEGSLVVAGVLNTVARGTPCQPRRLTLWVIIILPIL